MYVIFTNSSGRPKHAVFREANFEAYCQPSRQKNEDVRTTFLELHKAFLDQATITTGITALQILHGVGIISADVSGISTQLDGIAAQLKWVSRQVSDAGT
jgi:ABC-type Zn uptake system ZnuABC Zn-binding protein ZnuA